MKNIVVLHIGKNLLQSPVGRQIGISTIPADGSTRFGMTVINFISEHPQTEADLF